MKLIKVEYTADVEAFAAHTTDADGDVTPKVVEKGTVRKVDPISAKSLVEVRKVAKYVGDAEQKSEAKAAVKASATLPPPGAEDGPKDGK